MANQLCTGSREAARLASVLPNPRKFNLSWIPAMWSTLKPHLQHNGQEGIVVPEYDELNEGKVDDQSLNAQAIR